MGNPQLLELRNPSKTQTKDYSQYSDKELMYLCQKYGTQTILWRQRFIGLLPEVNRRRLYEKKGFSSIIEFGKRMAGLSEAQIRLAINLEKKFEDKPELHSALIDGKISINKLVRVTSIATAENEGELARCANVLSKASLDVLVKDMKQSGTYGMRIENGLFKPQIDVKYLPGQSEPRLGWGSFLSEHDEERVMTNVLSDVDNGTKLNFHLSVEVIEKLNALHEKGHDVNEIILKMLEKREMDIEERKDEIVAKIVEKEDQEPSRYISMKIKRILKEEYGTKCGVMSCKREAVQLHHTVPFSMNGSNAPDLLRPLCREHHDILHSVNIGYLAMKLRN